MSALTIPLADFRLLLERGEKPAILDVRTPGEYAKVHAADAELMPLDQLDVAAVASQYNAAGRAVYIICQSGARSARATQRLRESGLANAYSIEGGTDAWEKSGLPVVRRGGRVISLERQVRIGAGSLVFLGTILAITVHRYFLGIPLFVGAGLVFAGATDICGMALLLGKLPWNRARS
jgi:rhodanese-related sulfurtransferase